MGALMAGVSGETLASGATTYLVIGGILLTLVVLVHTWATATDVPKIRGIFEIPGSLPITGHLLELGDDHASVCEKWWRKYKQSLFQIKLGNTRAVVVNSFDDAKRMLVGHQSAVIDRPTLYTFHGVISSTKGFTIGSSPWSESCKNKRKAAGATLGRPAIKTYVPMFDLETYSLMRDTFRESNGGSIELDVRPYIQRLALNTTLTLCYGIRMGNVYDQMLREILEVGSAISLLRSASENMQDYVPILRYIPNNEKNRRSKDLRGRRDQYLDFLLDKVRDMIAAGTDKPCVSGAIFKGEETRLNDVEVSSICLSLVSGGFETIPGTLTSCIGSLSTPEGQRFQAAAYADIQRHYPDHTAETAWEQCVQEEKIPYINAIVKEAVRYYTVSAMSLPRKTAAPVEWDNGIIIPAKTMILVNAQAANHDVDHFGEDAATFNPERWLERTITTPSSSSSEDPPSHPTAAAAGGVWIERESHGIQHFGFGAGSRACSGQLVANRIIYAALIRLITAYRIEASDEAPPTTDYVDYNEMKSALVAIPRYFRVKLLPRDTAELEGCLKLAEERTRTSYDE